VTSASKQVSVVISKDGPYIVSGDAPLSEEIIGANIEGESIKWQRGKARLNAFDKVAGKTIEPHVTLAIGLIEDPVEGCSGPIWLRGGVALISADGHQYEIRNNMTVCRCGASKNKPFCDGKHASVNFKAKTKA
jgi:Iron-binding zinc finger CDGSH type